MATSAQAAPFDFTTLKLDVHLVQSMDGIYREEDTEDEDGSDALDDDDPWLKIYYVIIKTKSGERVGQFGYRVIDSTARRPDPWMMVGNSVSQYYSLALHLKLSERGGQMLEDFGKALWNENLPHDPMDGGLKDEFVSGDRKGTGVFGKEVNQGALAFFSDDQQFSKDDFFIAEKYRGRGIGTWAMKQIFVHPSMRGVKFVYAEPWATRNKDATATEAANARVQRFFRKVTTFFSSLRD
ncbi:hypothetical protein HWV62_40792 [Athelia sp. TMB]|nr:hypothetical protein HWV62_40792 [Athelia sp. TMB]